jgi:hypothetical protein
LCPERFLTGAWHRQAACGSSPFRGPVGDEEGWGFTGVTGDYDTADVQPIGREIRAAIDELVARTPAAKASELQPA